MIPARAHLLRLFLAPAPWLGVAAVLSAGTPPVSLVKAGDSTVTDMAARGLGFRQFKGPQAIDAEPRNPPPLADQTEFDAVVASDGAGTHLTVQSAIDAATSSTRPHRILVKPGIYKEHVVIPIGRPFLQLHGQPGETGRTVITLDTHVKTPVPGDPSGKTLATPDSATVLVRATDFTARNLTFENSTSRDARVQALAVFVSGDRAAFYGCRFLGWQDTLRADSPKDGPAARQYFADCHIEGHVDFIYAAGTAVFDRCHIHAKADGYLTAASTPEESPFGYVFLDCKITAGREVERGFYLGRPWRPHAATAFLRCQMPEKLIPAGWHHWDKVENEKTARYAEYGSTGPGAAPSKRVSWARQLTRDEAAAYTVGNILGGSDGWRPATP